VPEALAILVGEDESGQRLDRFLANHLEEWSRSTIQQWIRDGNVLVGGRQHKASYRIRQQDSLSILPPPPAPVDLIPEDIPLSIVFEDDVLVVIDKPADLVVHPGAGRPGGTLVNALIYHFEQVSRRQSIRPGIIHRLDKDTSGLLVVAKNERAHEAISRQFRDRLVQKEYIALLYGRIESGKGSIELPIGRHPTIRTKMSTRSRSSRAARTDYVVQRYLDEFSFVRVKLHTGRTHQIRVHFQSLGHPVVGDGLYAGKRHETIGDTGKKVLVKNLQRHFLHATHLAFAHPITGEKCSFDSCLPGDLADLLDGLEP
jgi:23S rRNA pseudouridine1911/1915/1917 synthase